MSLKPYLVTIVDLAAIPHYYLRQAAQLAEAP